MSDDSVRSCWERVTNAAEILATGEGPIAQRLRYASVSIGLLGATDFPRDLRRNFAQIYEAITAAGSFDQSVRQMSTERAREVAQWIWDLAAEIQRRSAIEDHIEDTNASKKRPSTATSGLPEGFGPDTPTASDAAHTDHTGVSFAVKEHGHGEPWVMFEQDEPGLPVLNYGDAFLGLEFRAGVSIADADRFAAEMRRMFDVLTCTKFDT